MTESPAPTKPVRSYAAQDQRLADRITAARQIIETVRADAELTALLAGRGYDQAALAEGLVLQEAAQTAFAARQMAMAALQAANAALQVADAAARRAYTDFRATARAVFTAPADRTALGLAGIAPKDTQKFITQARASYAAAQAAPYQAPLSTYGYPQTAIAAATAALDALAAADERQNAAAGAARQATADRDAAAKALTAWVSRFRQIAKVALRDRPALAQKLLL